MDKIHFHMWMHIGLHTELANLLIQTQFTANNECQDHHRIDDVNFCKHITLIYATSTVDMQNRARAIVCTLHLQ